MDGFTTLDWIVLQSDAIVKLLAQRGLSNARVVGWAAARMEAIPGVPAEIEVDTPPVTDLAASDLAALSKEISALVGEETVVWAVNASDRKYLPGEKIHYL